MTDLQQPLKRILRHPRRGPGCATAAFVLAALLALTPHALASGPKATKDDIARGRAAYVELLESHELDPEVKHEVRLKVFKEDRKLELIVDEVVVARWDVGLGWAPQRDKEVEGDGRTPEGEYRVVTRHTSKFHLFLGLDYPNEDDVARALEAGRIDARTARKVRDKLEAGERPPWDTAMGGAIGVHGGGGGVDWTAGCIALDDAQIEIIYAAAKMGTVVEVLP